MYIHANLSLSEHRYCGYRRILASGAYARHSGISLLYIGEEYYRSREYGDEEENMVMIHLNGYTVPSEVTIDIHVSSCESCRAQGGIELGLGSERHTPCRRACANPAGPTDTVVSCPVGKKAALTTQRPAGVAHVGRMLVGRAAAPTSDETEKGTDEDALRGKTTQRCHIRPSIEDILDAYRREAVSLSATMLCN